MNDIITSELMENIKNELKFKIKLIDPVIRKDKISEYIVIGELNEHFSLTDPRCRVNCRPKLKCLPDEYKLSVQPNESIILRKKCT